MQSSADTALQSEYAYFDRSGKQIGQTQGATPQEDLYRQAHYVVVNQEDMIKNCDSKTQIAADLKQCEKDLLNTSVSNMSEILYLNRLIRALKRCLAA